MKPSHFIVGLAAVSQGISATALSDAQDGALDTRSPESQNSDRSTTNEELWKRKGGGGSGGRGGSGGSSGGSSSGSSSGGRGSSSSNTGGSTTTGSGVRPSYGGGTYYGGGAKQPYKSGNPSPSGIVPFVVGGAALTTLGFVGATWAYGAYVYPYTHHYWYRNVTNNNNNETKPVTCLCDYYETCGCDDNGNQTYFNSVIGNGSYASLDRSLVTVADNETTHESTIYIKGSLANGTTSSGGTEDPNAAGGDLISLARAVGWWPVVTTAMAIAFI